MNKSFGLLALLGSFFVAGCSHVKDVYVAPKTISPGQMEVKRVSVLGWSSVDHPALEPVLEAVASDYLNLRKTYLVQPSPTANLARQGWQTACQGKTEGVLFVRALSSEVHGRAPAIASMRLSAELFRCHDGALLYRSEGALSHKDNDRALSQMRAHYVEALGADKGAYVPCVFSLLQEMLSPLPSPALTEAEVEEKIELGRLLSPSEAVTTLAQGCKGL